MPDTHIDELKTLFESYNNQIKFTIEKEKNKKITFLDIEIERCNNNKTIKTNWYQKSTSSGRILNYLSKHPHQMKKNVADQFIYKILYVSDPKFLSCNIDKIHTNLNMNNYPRPLINKLIHKNLHKIQQINQANRNNNRVEQHINNYPNSEQTDTPENSQIPKLIGSIKYIPSLTDKIKSTFNKYENSVIGCKPINTTANLYTKLKDTIHKEHRDIIYQIECKDCEKSYIGQSKHLKTRISRHESDCKHKRKTTALAFHHTEYGHNFNFEKPKILETIKHKRKREYIESAYILLNKHKVVNFKCDTKNINIKQKQIIAKLRYENDRNQKRRIHDNTNNT